jgi:hypothetical protein
MTNMVQKTHRPNVTTKPQVNDLNALVNSYIDAFNQEEITEDIDAQLCEESMLNQLRAIDRLENKEEQKVALVVYFQQVGDDMKQLMNDFIKSGFVKWYFILHVAYECNNKMVFAAVIEHCMTIQFPLELNKLLSMVYKGEIMDTFYITRAFSYIKASQQINAVYWTFHVAVILKNHIYVMLEQFLIFIEENRIECDWVALSNLALELRYDHDIIVKFTELRTQTLNPANQSSKRPIKHLRPAIKRQPNTDTKNITINILRNINDDVKTELHSNLMKPISKDNSPRSRADSFESTTTHSGGSVIMMPGDNIIDYENDAANNDNDNIQNKRVKFDTEDVKMIENKDIYENDDDPVGAFVIDEPNALSTRQQWLKQHEQRPYVAPPHYSPYQRQQYATPYGYPTYTTSHLYGYPQYKPPNVKLLTTLLQVLRESNKDNTEFDPEVIEDYVNDYLRIEEKNSGPPPSQSKLNDDGLSQRRDLSNSGEVKQTNDAACRFVNESCNIDDEFEEIYKRTQSMISYIA